MNYEWTEEFRLIHPHPWHCWNTQTRKLRRCRLRTPAALEWCEPASSYSGKHKHGHTHGYTRHSRVFPLKTTCSYSKESFNPFHVLQPPPARHITSFSWLVTLGITQAHKYSVFNCMCAQPPKKNRKNLNQWEAGRGIKKNNHLWDLCGITTWLNWVISTGSNHHPPKPLRKPWTGSTEGGKKDMERHQDSI